MYADVTVLVDFGKTQITNIQTTAVVKIELGRHIQNGAGINICAKGDTLRGNTANRTRFHSQNKVISTSFFPGDQTNAIGNTDADITDRTFTHFV